ncbi:MAG: hypothetical protein ACYC33_02605 [Thermoleophilia bacterium]
MTDRTDSRLQPSTCVHCASPLVQPTEWARVDDSQWLVSVRCPECYRGYEVSLTQEQVKELSYVVEEGFRSLLEVIDQLDHEAFEGECETIIEALRSDNLYPMDF